MVELIKIEDPVKRDFYISMCTQVRWSVRTLRERMSSSPVNKSPIAIHHPVRRQGYRTGRADGPGA